MDFGALPPEVNSARMYAGAGAAPMMAAASAWKGLAAELSSAASSYQSVISGLVSQRWMGPASASMAAAVAPYVTWMATTAAQAEQAASQAYAAAAAYEGAFAMTVPPPVVAANRAQQAALVATNVLGQNTPAIAATEAHYGQMWAQDAAAMYGYAANSAAATQVSPFSSPPQTTNSAGVAGQSSAAAQAAGTVAASNTQTALSQFTSAVPSTLQSMAAPVQSATTTSATSPFATGIADIADLLGLQPGDVANGTTNLLSSSFSPMGAAGITQFMADLAVVRGAAIAAGDPLGLGAIDLPGVGTPGLGIPGLGLGIPGLGVHGLGGVVPGAGMSAIGPLSAGMGRATAIGALSVPQTWASAAPAANASLASFPAANWTVPQAEPGGMPGMPGMPMAGSGSRGFGFAGPRYGFKPTVMARPVVAG